MSDKLSWLQKDCPSFSNGAASSFITMEQCFRSGLAILEKNLAGPRWAGEKFVTQVMPSWLALQKGFLDASWKFIQTGLLDFKLRQTRFPKSKKRRIQKKWRTDRRNFKREPDDIVYVLAAQRTIIGHPLVLRKLIDAVTKQVFEEEK